MKLREISYELLLIVRGGYISDDERIDLRLIDALVHQYRLDYIKDGIKGSQNADEALRQHASFDLSLIDHGMFARLGTVVEMELMIMDSQELQAEEGTIILGVMVF